jgi:hypothetical protein
MPIPKEDLTELTIKLRDPDYQLVRLIEYIRILAGPGHSFEVVVDPDMREHRKSFGIDGDGVFFIKELKMNGKKVVMKDDKIIEGYLKKLQ